MVSQCFYVQAMLVSLNLALKLQRHAVIHTFTYAQWSCLYLKHTLQIYARHDTSIQNWRYVTNNPPPGTLHVLHLKWGEHTEGQYLYKFSHFSASNNMQFPFPTPSHDHRPDVVHVLLPHRHFPLPTLRNYHIARGHPIHPAGASPIRTWAVLASKRNY